MQRFKMIVEVHLVLLRSAPKGDHSRPLPAGRFPSDSELLMLRRYNTGFEDGNYSLVAGHVDAGETFSEAMAREAQEEAGLALTKQNLVLVHAMNRWSDEERLSLFFSPTSWTGTPFNNEPDKCDELAWYPLANRPANTIAYINHALENIQAGMSYSEFGWPDADQRPLVTLS